MLSNVMHGSVRCLLLSASMVQIAMTALDSIFLLQGGTQVRRHLPEELSNFYTTMQKHVEAAQEDQSLQKIGNGLFASLTRASRLSDAPDMLAWGNDKNKGIAAAGMKTDGYTAGGLLSTSTDLQNILHMLGGATILSPGPADKTPKPVSVVGAAEAKPGGIFDYVAAVPKPGADDRPGLDYIQGHSQVEAGSIPREQVPMALKALLAPEVQLIRKSVEALPPLPLPDASELVASTAARTPASGEPGPKPAESQHLVEAAPAAPVAPPAALVEPAPVEQQPQAPAAAVTPPARGVEQSPVEPPHAAAPAAPMTPSVEPTLAELQPHAAAPATPPAVPAAADSSPSDPASLDLVEYQLKLMAASFPFEKAFAYALMRGWAVEPGHQLPPADGTRQLSFLDGMWGIESYAEDPGFVGAQLALQDGQVRVLGGALLGNASFQALSSQMYAMVLPLTYGPDNITVDLYKICHLEGDALVFEGGGGMWRHLSATLPPSTTLQAPEKAVSQEPGVPDAVKQGGQPLPVAPGSAGKSPTIEAAAMAPDFRQADGFMNWLMTPAVSDVSVQKALKGIFGGSLKWIQNLIVPSE